MKNRFRLPFYAIVWLLTAVAPGQLSASSIWTLVNFPRFTSENRIISSNTNNSSADGLVLWNRLDISNAVVPSVVGADGIMTAGRTVAGRFGNAIELNMQQQFGVTFPIDALTTSVGCLEFWAKLSDFPDTLPTGASPGLIGCGDFGQHDGHLMFFSANDGGGNGGLCVRSMLSLGTGSFGSWTYASAIGGGAISDWHHYAVVWNAENIPGVAGGTRKVVVYVDGSLNSGHYGGSAGTSAFVVGGGSFTRFGLLNHQGLVNGRIAFDNLKIWNYAKTNFADRFTEGDTNSVTLLVVGARGDASPDNGSYTCQVGTSLSVRVSSPVIDGTTRYVCTGASVVGNDYTQNAVTNVALTMTNNAAVTWNWQTQYQLATAVSGSGTVTSASGWCVAGSNVTLIATADSGSHFSGWTGDLDGCTVEGSSISVAMTQGRAITAQFAIDSSGSSADGLVLWNRLDISNAVVPSVVGADGIMTAGRTVAGRFGNAIELNMQQQFGVTFPIDALTTSVGCLEFWAKLSDFPDTLPTGASPGLIGCGDFGQHDGHLMFFSANDGGGNGGLCVRSMLSLGTGSFGSWTYASAIGGGAISDWHHYAVVWNAENIPGVAGGTQKVVVYVDGNLNSGHYGGSAGTSSFVVGGVFARFGLLNHQGLVNGRIAFDNLKIWNYAKTNFADRCIEGDANSVTLLVAGARGDASPDNGSYACQVGTSLSARVSSPVIAGTTQYVCTGASVVGNDFSQNTTTNVTLTLTNNATVMWNWQTQFQLATIVSGGGEVTPADGWYADGSNVVLTAIADPNWHFVRWSGDTNGCLATFTSLTVPITRARTIAAVFAGGSTPVISGRITRFQTKEPLAGVTVSFSGSVGTTTSDTNGNYSMLVPFGWSGTATASYGSGGFAKPTLSFKRVVKNQTKANFVWAPDPVITGRVWRNDTKAGMPGVAITADHGGGVTNTDENGNYSLTVPYNWTGEITPMVSDSGKFSPGHRSVQKITQNRRNVSFVWNPTASHSASRSVSKGSMAITFVASRATDKAAGGALVVHVLELAQPAQVANGELATVQVVGGQIQVCPVVADAVGGMTRTFTLDSQGADANNDGLPDSLAMALGDNLREGVVLLTLQCNDGTLTATTPFVDLLTVEGVAQPLGALPATWRLRSCK
ncbi:MAG: hypothetical protein H7831_12695 [Magnetococcus sp. WYHC-3]